MHEVLRAETRGSGVRATLVSPGPVNTSLWDEIEPETRPGFTARRDMLAADAVAAAVRYALVQPADVNVDEIRLSRS
jgi:NADP-dependent 3-hydroxy acid dehydrogenase YdfG